MKKGRAGLFSFINVQRILVFMTNLFDRLDQALIRPGKTAKHMEMSCCWFVGFMVLAKCYLVFDETDMTPARSCGQPLHVPVQEEDTNI